MVVAAESHALTMGYSLNSCIKWLLNVRIRQHIICGRRS